MLMKMLVPTTGIKIKWIKEIVLSPFIFNGGNGKMKYRKIFPFILIISCIFFLILCGEKFQFVQDMLILESNNLFSPNHVLADKSINSVWKSVQTTYDDFHVFGLLEKTSNQTVMAFYATNYSKLKPPIKSGIFFTIPDSKEVVVGENIKTSIRNGMEYFNYKNESYLVIGKLGISNNSPLKNYILINDSSLLEEPYIHLIFDGVNIGKITWLKSKPMENKGVVRWFNISFVSKWIKWVTWLVIAFASSLAAYSYGIATKETRLMRFQIGVRMKDIMKSDLLILTLTTLFMILVTWLFRNVKDIVLSIINLYFSYLIFYIPLVGTHIILTIHQINTTGGVM